MRVVRIKKLNDGAEIFGAIQGLMDDLDLQVRLQSVRTVFIKPNLVTDVPEYIAQGANTDVRIIDAVLHYLSGFSHLEVLLGECETGTALKGRRLERALEIMGVLELQQKYQFRIINMTHDPEVREYEIPNGRYVKRLKLSPAIMDADLIINLPKLKTHKYSTITCSLKNMFGTIPDPLRVIYHHNIHQVIADINQLYYSRMVVLLDGIVAMEGAGPIYGRAVPMNLILAGTDPLDVDSVAARVMGFDPLQIRHIRLFANSRSVDPLEVEVRGADLDSVRQNFKPARKNLFVRCEGELMRHRWIVRLLFSDWFRRHVTYRLNPLLARLRGGSFSWYIGERDGGDNGTAGQDSTHGGDSPK